MLPLRGILEIQQATQVISTGLGHEGQGGGLTILSKPCSHQTSTKWHCALCSLVRKQNVPLITLTTTYSWASEYHESHYAPL